MMYDAVQWIEKQAVSYFSSCNVYSATFRLHEPDIMYIISYIINTPREIASLPYLIFLLRIHRSLVGDNPNRSFAFRLSGFCGPGAVQNNPLRYPVSLESWNACGQDLQQPRAPAAETSCMICSQESKIPFVVSVERKPTEQRTGGNERKR